MPLWVERLRDWARALKTEVAALYHAARDPRTPWTVRLLAVLVVGYALSPIDLIPDIVPVLGLLDDLILLPAGLWLVRRLIPTDVLAVHRARALADGGRLPPSRVAAAVIIMLWIAGALAVAHYLLRS